MKYHLGLAAGIAFTSLAGISAPAQAQEQVVETVVCQSDATTRASCPVNGEIVSAGIVRQLGEGTPCFLSFTWGFEENGIWTARGCSAEFAVTIERPEQTRVVDPEVLRERMRSARQEARALRQQLVKAQEERQVIETELNEAQALIRSYEASGATPAKKGKKRPQMAIRSVAACSNKARREALKTGATKSNVTEILSARPTQGAWLVIGRVSFQLNGERSTDFFRCWAERGKVVSYDNKI